MRTESNVSPPYSLDPILNEYEAFVDKSAGLKTIAFKYFGADINQASEYLRVTDTISNTEKDNLLKT